MSDAEQPFPVDTEVSPLNQEILGLVRHKSEVHYALETLFRSCAPDCIPAENTMHLINQIDNVIAGYRSAPDVRDIFVVTASDLEMEFTKSWVCAAFGTEVEALDYTAREASLEYRLTVSRIRCGARPSVREREAEQDELAALQAMPREPCALLPLSETQPRLRKRPEMRCDECKFWDRDDREQKRAGTLKVRRCARPMQWWNASEWTDEPDLENEWENLRTLVPEAEGLKMFTQDGSDYRADLLTAADFYCAHFEQH